MKSEVLVAEVDDSGGGFRLLNSRVERVAGSAKSERIAFSLRIEMDRAPESECSLVFLVDFLSDFALNVGEMCVLLLSFFEADNIFVENAVDGVSLVVFKQADVVFERADDYGVH